MKNFNADIEIADYVRPTPIKRQWIPDVTRRTDTRYRMPVTVTVSVSVAATISFDVVFF